MTRRMTLPAAEELFRATGASSSRATAGRPGSVHSAQADPAVLRAVADEQPSRVSGVRRTTAASTRPAGDRQPTGRERHEEKITVYVSAAELLDLERARLTLRGDHGMAVDRGRIVREALAVVLADLDAQGEASVLVRRLRGR